MQPIIGRPLIAASSLFLLSISLFSQERDLHKHEAEVRRAKIEEILRIQDLRTPHDSKLRAALSDPDPLVRERAFLAYASLQDSSALPQLTAGLADPSAGVQEAAAFAIGQTGVVLGEPGRRLLEEELLWKRLSETTAKDRLIEELGKFGTAEALRQLLLRVGNVFPEENQAAMQLAIARFATRNIFSEDAVSYLVRFLRPADQVRWQVIYALQRIGDHNALRKDLEQLVRVRDHPDPIVRMFLASFLGKVQKFQGVFPALEQLAEADPDWRVRVNGLKALGMLGVGHRPASVEILRKGMFDGQPNVALTAIGVLGDSDIDPRDSTPIVHQTIEDLQHIAENRGNDYHWQVQAAAASTLAGLMGIEGLRWCVLHADMVPHLKAELLRATGRTAAAEALPILEAGVEDVDPQVAVGALDGMQTLIQRHAADTSILARAYRLGLNALLSTDVAVVTTAASLLGHSALLNQAAAGPLIRRLSSLKVPDDIEAFQEICSTLSKLNDPGAIPALLDLLKIRDPAVALAAARALETLTGKAYRVTIPSQSEPLSTDLDFVYLRSLPDRIGATLETSRGNIELELEPKVAPFTIVAISKLAMRRGFYRGRVFHRVVPNFVIQGGDPRGDGWGGPGFTIRSEFSPSHFETGTVGIASAGKDTEGCQFFITQSPQPHLDGRYTIIGRVVEGENIVDRIMTDDRIFDLKIHLGE
jgi:peptidylprolyl isomerase